LALGLTVAQIDSWPEEIAKVTLADLNQVANKYLDIRRSVTGTLVPTSPEAEAVATPASVPPAASPVADRPAGQGTR
jgi:zinc protease